VVVLLLLVATVLMRYWQIYVRIAVDGQPWV
jgi:hypothetical protein